MGRPLNRAVVSVFRTKRFLSTVFTARAFLVAMGATVGCDASISSLDPATGHDRALVVANGFPIIDGIFLWDPGASEKWRAGGLAGKMFTVPGGAASWPPLRPTVCRWSARFLGDVYCR
jgi:hypothetical protein